MPRTSRAPRATDTLAAASRAMPVLACALIALLALAGGSARADVAQVALPRAAAVLMLMGMALTLPREAIDRLRGLWLLSVAAFVLVAAQLVPLPPAVWSALPGRALAWQVGEVAGIAQPWRPLSLVPDRTANALVALLVPLGTLAAITMLARDRPSRIIHVLAGLIALSAAFGAAQAAAGSGSALRLYAITNQDASVGIFANRNHHAVLLACAMPVIAWLAQRHAARFPSPVAAAGLAAAAALFVVLLILTTGSRGGLAALGLSTLLTGAMIVRQRMIGVRLFAALAAAGGAVIVALLVYGGNLRTLERLSDSEVGNLRWTLLGDYRQLALDYLPFGSGFGSFPDVYQVIERESTLRPTYLNAAHNDLAQLAIEGGVPALLLLAALLLWWGRAAWRSWSAAPDRQDRGGPASAQLGSIVGAVLLAASLVDYPLRTPILASVFVAACALMTIRPRRASRGGGRSRAYY